MPTRTCQRVKKAFDGMIALGHRGLDLAKVDQRVTASGNIWKAPSGSG